MLYSPDNMHVTKDADPRELPAYTLAEAAHYLLVPLTTVRSWVSGQPYRTASGRRFSVDIPV